MTPAQQSAVDMVLGTLPTYLAYQNVDPTQDSAVLIIEPVSFEFVISVGTDGDIQEFRDGVWTTGWEA